MGDTTAIRTVVGEAAAVAEHMELGQAATPLTDLFREIGADLDGRVFPVTLLALGDGSKGHVLRWLYDQPFAHFTVQVSAQIGLIELHMRDHGYVLEDGQGSRREFEDLASFQQAMEASDLFARSVDRHLHDPPKITGNSGGAVKDLKVLLPESAALVREHPALMTRLVRQSALLVIVASPTHVLTETDRVVITDLLEEIPAVWPVLMVDELADNAELPARGWWHEIRATRALSAKLLTTHVAAPYPEFLTQIDDPDRASLLLARVARRFAVAAETLSEHFEHTLQQLEVRKKREQDRAKDGASSAHETGASLSELRATFAAEIQRIQRKLADRSRRTQLKGGEVDERLKAFADSATVADLRTEPGFKVLKLSLDDRFVHAFSVEMKSLVKDTMKSDLDFIESNVAAVVADLESEVADRAGFAVALDRSAPDERQLWSDLKEALGVELRYSGELRKRGFMQRLGEGRRSVFVILMSASLLGYLGLNVRDAAWVGWMMLPVFFGAIAWSYIAWRREDRERLDKEIEKVRGEVLQNARRQLGDLERLKMQRLTEHIEGLRERWQRQVDEAQHSVSERAQVDDRRTTDQARKRAQALEQKFSDWRSLRGAIDGVTRRAREVADAANAALRRG